MARITRDDGVEIHWEARGEGPPVVLAHYWSGHPSAFENLTEELASDHTMVSYDSRGTGRSTRRGPFDMETGAGDLAAIAEAAGGDAVILAMTDAVNRAVRVAAERPDLARAVVSMGSAPVTRESFKHTDALIASDNVVEAFIEMLSTSYRGALQALMPQANQQMTEDEAQERIDMQAEYCPQETAVAMVRAWVTDDPSEPALAIGDRLFILYTDDVAGPWFPRGPEALTLFRKLLPKANFVEMEDGIVSRPDITAGVIREITARIKSSA